MAMVKCGDAPGVVLGLGVLEVERIAQDFERDVIRLFEVGERRFPLLCTGGNQRLQIGAIGIVLALQAPILERAPDGVQ